MASQDPQTQVQAPQETRAEFWRRTPPALFPTMMGLLGLGLAWRAASGFAGLAISPMIGLTILALCSVLFLFVLACYLSKLSVRLGVSAVMRLLQRIFALIDKLWMFH